MKIETLIEDIYAELQKPDSDYHHYMEARAKDSVVIQDEVPTRERSGLRFSKLGETCLTKLWLEINEPDSSSGFDGQTILKFQYGHLIEDYLLWLAEKAGHSVTHRQAEVSVLGVKGHIDAIIDGHLVDVKTASGYGFTKFESGSLGDDPFGYAIQLSSYYQALRDSVPISPICYFLVVNKENGSICLMKFLPHDILLEKYIDGLQKELARMDNPKPQIKPVEDGKSGNMKLDTKCRYCNFKFRCYPETRVFDYSGSPRFLTTVSRIPNVPEITTKVREKVSINED